MKRWMRERKKGWKDEWKKELERMKRMKEKKDEKMNEIKKKKDEKMNEIKKE